MTKIGIIADTEKAFLQIALQPKERDVTRFLWLKDIKQPASPKNLVTYRFIRIPFGIISSPFLLGATIKYHLTPKDNQPGHNLSDNFYVDNLITGEDNMEEALQMYSKAKKLFLDISMKLRDWNSYSPGLNRKIAGRDRMKETITKVWGLQWDTITDELMVNTKTFGNSMTATTKRQVLTTIASLFDPLEYLQLR